MTFKRNSLFDKNIRWDSKWSSWLYDLRSKAHGLQIADDRFCGYTSQPLGSDIFLTIAMLASFNQETTGLWDNKDVSWICRAVSERSMRPRGCRQMTRSQGKNISNYSLNSSEDYTRCKDCNRYHYEHIFLLRTEEALFLCEQPTLYETRRLASLSSFVGASPPSSKASFKG